MTMLPESLDRRLTDAERREITRVLRKRFPWMAWASTAFGCAVGLAWLVAFIVAIDLLVNTPWSLERMMNQLGRVGIALPFVAGPGIGMLILVLAKWFGDRWLLRRYARAYFDRPRCLHCGYSLESLKPCDGALLCPECGKQSRLKGAPA